MSTFINCKVTWADNSSGVTDETGQELQIYTDSPSFVPNVPVNLLIAPHPWMQLLPVAAGQTEAQFRLEAPVTFITFRIRQYNANGPGEWSAPAGTTFSIAQTAGTNTPQAPSVPGFVITEGGIVVPPPPPPPPADPPPPPPPTGGGTGTTSNYIFTAQFSGVDGQSGWSYADATGTAMTYSSADSLWNGSQTYMGIWPGGAHPGSSIGARLRWTVPETGVMNIGGTTQLYSTTGNTGVTVTVKQNGSTLETKNLTTTAVAAFTSSGVAVTAGDTTDFILTTNGAITNNSTSLAPSIQLTTDGTTPTDPIVSSVSPTSLSLSVGGAGSFTVSLSSAPSASAVVALSSSDVTKATVPATLTIPAGQISGVATVTGVAAGSSDVTATYNSSSQVCAVTVSNPASSSWTNAPAGGTVLLDKDFSNLTGLVDDYSSTILTTDASAPVSPPNVGLHRLGAFQREGGGQLHYNAPALYRELYCGFSWRTNAQFQGRAVQGNKVFFLRGPYMNGVFALLGGPNQGQSNFRLAFSHNTSALNNSHIMGGDSIGNLAECNVGNGTIIMGVWYRIEVHIRCSTSYTARDGFIRWWINGTLVGNYTQFNYSGPNGEGANEWMMNQTWDGSPDLGVINTVNWDHYVDHVYLVGKN